MERRREVAPMATNIARSDFDSAYRAHLANVRQFVFQFVQDIGLAEELAQDAFLKALNSWESFRGEAPERIWLLRIARNVCLDYLRSPRSRARGAVSLDASEGDRLEAAVHGLAGERKEQPLPVEQVAVRDEMTECVQEFVLSLPETLRSALILHDMQGLTNPEIAQVLGCSLQAAKMRLHRARVALREMMEERCDLFHDERNVLACLPAPPEKGFVSIDELSDSRPVTR